MFSTGTSNKTGGGESIESPSLLDEFFVLEGGLGLEDMGFDAELKTSTAPLFSVPGRVNNWVSASVMSSFWERLESSPKQPSNKIGDIHSVVLPSNCGSWPDSSVFHVEFEILSVFLIFNSEVTLLGVSFEEV